MKDIFYHGFMMQMVKDDLGILTTQGEQACKAIYIICQCFITVINICEDALIKRKGLLWLLFTGFTS
jgi:hypothetical protein